MTPQELNERATARAITERLHTFKIAGAPTYMVRSRETEVGSMHQIHVSSGAVDHCTCTGWHYRQSCTHAAAVARRLEREGRTHTTRTTDDEPMHSAPTSRGQLFRNEVR